MHTAPRISSARPRNNHDSRGCISSLYIGLVTRAIRDYRDIKYYFAGIKVVKLILFIAFLITCKWF